MNFKRFLVFQSVKKSGLILGEIAHKYLKKKKTDCAQSTIKKLFFSFFCIFKQCDFFAKTVYLRCQEK